MKIALPLNNGFTIIELLISVAIGGLLIGAVFASYRGIGDKQAVKQAGISFQTNLKSVQQKALTGTKPTGCSGTLTGYQVSYISLTSFSVTSVCTTTNLEPVTFTLPQGVSFQAAFNPNNIFFSVLSAQVDGAQTIIIAKNSHSYLVTIEPSGVIRGESL